MQSNSIPLFATFFLFVFNACGFQLLALYKNGFEVEYQKIKSRNYKKFHTLYHREAFVNFILITWVGFAISAIGAIATAIYHHFN